MQITLENVGAYLAILGTTAMVVNSVIIAPLKDSIDKLTNVTEGLNTQLVAQGQQIAVVDNTVKSLHKRQDRFEERLRDLEHKCDNCNLKG